MAHTFLKHYVTIGGLDLELPSSPEEMFAENAWYSTTTFCTFVNVPLLMTNDIAVGLSSEGLVASNLM